MKLSIIIPAYNEEKRIGRTLSEYSKYFDSILKTKKVDYELLIVINNTKDNTKKVVASYQKLNKRIRYLDLKQGGKGYAVLMGFREALKGKNDLIGFVDADMATPPEAFYWLVQRVIDGADAAIADRTKKESKIVPEHTFRRVIVSRVFNFCVRSLLFIHHKDTQCGAKVFTREALKEIVNFLGTTNWAFDVEIIYELERAGFEVVDEKTIWFDMKDSKIKLIRSSIQMFFAIAQMRINRSRLRKLLVPLKKAIKTLWNIIK